jgi:hypothetical protein
MTMNTPSDHNMLVAYKRSKCLLCNCDTTVRCATCQVHLCKNAFENNDISCFQRFHSHELLHLSPRNGRKYIYRVKQNSFASATCDSPPEDKSTLGNVVDTANATTIKKNNKRKNYTPKRLDNLFKESTSSKVKKRRTARRPLTRSQKKPKK